MTKIEDVDLDDHDDNHDHDDTNDIPHRYLCDFRQLNQGNHLETSTVLWETTFFQT